VRGCGGCLHQRCPLPFRRHHSAVTFYPSSCPSSCLPADELRSYLKQLREALVPKLVDRLYSGEGGAVNKFWMAFAKRKFLNKEFP